MDITWLAVAVVVNFNLEGEKYIYYISFSNNCVHPIVINNLNKIYTYLIVFVRLSGDMHIRAYISFVYNVCQLKHTWVPL